eukprot:TRINITY_DN7040_c0_g2_i1.p1 TRINITY_DN7040_c0_g2~~TRINITY_DN7040_c0_g2_i1.p1  ORF type:complete len:1667 (+),score=423.51 TRINITY_DN7040_c0_g2_i1:154-5154(+)
MEILQALSSSEMDRLRAQFNGDLQGSLSREAFIGVVSGLVERKCAEGVMRPDTRWRAAGEVAGLFDEVNYRGGNRVTWEDFSTYLIAATTRGVSADTQDDPISPYFRVKMLWDPYRHDRVKRAHYVSGWDKLITCNTRNNVSHNAVHAPAERMKELGLLPIKAPVLAASFVPRHHALVCATGDMTLIAFDTIHPSLPIRRSFSCDRSLLQLEYHSQGGSLWMGDRDGSVATMSDDFFRNLPGQSTVATPLAKASRDRVQWHTGAISGIQFIQRTGAPEVITSSMDGTILVHDVERAKAAAARGKADPAARSVSIAAHPEHGVRDISWSNWSNLLVSVGALEPHPHAWVLNYPRTPFRLIDDLAPHKAPLVAVHAVKGQPQVLSCDKSGVVKVWDLRQFRAVQTLAPERGERTGAGVFYTSAMCYVPTTKQLCTHGHRSFAWDYDARLRAHSAHDQQVVGVLFSFSAGCFVTYSAHQMKVWAARTGSVSAAFDINSIQGRLSSAVLDATGRRVFVGSSRGEVASLLLSTGDVVFHYIPMSAAVTCVCYTDAQRRLLISTDASGLVRFLSDRTDGTAGAVLRELRTAAEVTCGTWLSAAGLFAYGTARGEALCCEVAAGRVPNETKLVAGACEVNAVASMHPLPCVAVADATGHIYLWALRPYRRAEGVSPTASGGTVLCVRRLANPDYHRRKREAQIRSRQRAAQQSGSDDSEKPSNPYVRRPVANCVAWCALASRIYVGEDGGWVLSYDASEVVSACALAPLGGASPSSPGSGAGADSTPNLLPVGVCVPMLGSCMRPTAQWRAHRDEVGQITVVESPPCVITLSATEPIVLVWSLQGAPLADLAQGRREDPGHSANSRFQPYRFSFDADPAQLLQELQSPRPNEARAEEEQERRRGEEEQEKQQQQSPMPRARRGRASSASAPRSPCRPGGAVTPLTAAPLRAPPAPQPPPPPPQPRPQAAASAARPAPPNVSFSQTAQSGPTGASTLESPGDKCSPIQSGIEPPSTVQLLPLERPQPLLSPRMSDAASDTAPPAEDAPAARLTAVMPQQHRLLDYLSQCDQEEQPVATVRSPRAARPARQHAPPGRRSVTQTIPHGIVTYLTAGPLQASPPASPGRVRPGHRAPGLRPLPEEPGSEDRWRGGLLPDVVSDTCARITEQEDVLAALGCIDQANMKAQIPRVERSLRGAALEAREHMLALAEEAARKRAERRRPPSERRRSSFAPAASPRALLQLSSEDMASPLPPPPGIGSPAQTPRRRSRRRGSTAVATERGTSDQDSIARTDTDGAEGGAAAARRSASQGSLGPFWRARRRFMVSPRRLSAVAYAPPPHRPRISQIQLEASPRELSPRPEARRKSRFKQQRLRDFVFGDRTATVFHEPAPAMKPQLYPHLAPRGLAAVVKVVIPLAEADCCSRPQSPGAEASARRNRPWQPLVPPTAGRAAAAPAPCAADARARVSPAFPRPSVAQPQPQPQQLQQPAFVSPRDEAAAAAQRQFARKSQSDFEAEEEAERLRAVQRQARKEALRALFAQRRQQAFTMRIGRADEASAPPTPDGPAAAARRAAAAHGRQPITYGPEGLPGAPPQPPPPVSQGRKRYSRECIVGTRPPAQSHLRISTPVGGVAQHPSAPPEPQTARVVQSRPEEPAAPGTPRTPDSAAAGVAGIF